MEEDLRSATILEPCCGTSGCDVQRQLCTYLTRSGRKVPALGGSNFVQMESRKYLAPLCRALVSSLPDAEQLQHLHVAINDQSDLTPEDVERQFCLHGNTKLLTLCIHFTKFVWSAMNLSRLEVLFLDYLREVYRVAKNVLLAFRRGRSLSGPPHHLPPPVPLRTAVLPQKLVQMLKRTQEFTDVKCTSWPSERGDVSTLFGDLWWRARNTIGSQQVGRRRRRPTPSVINSS